MVYSTSLAVGTQICLENGKREEKESPTPHQVEKSIVDFFFLKCESEQS